MGSLTVLHFRINLAGGTRINSEPITFRRIVPIDPLTQLIYRLAPGTEV
jgi:hypothetical protein